MSDTVQTSDHDNNTSKHTPGITFKAVAELLIAVAAPLPFIALVCGYFKIDQQKCNNFSIVTEVLLVALWLLWRFNKKARDLFKSRWVFVLLWTLSLVVAVVSLLLFAKRNQRQAESWENWKEQLVSRAEPCKGDLKCLAEALASAVPSEPRGPEQRLASVLSDDLQAGEIVRDSDLFAPLLQRFSIGTSFLGTGISEPVAGKEYAAARAPEYLIPNYRETDSRVWIWELDQGALDVPLKDVLNTNLPLQAQTDFPAVRKSGEYKQFKNNVQRHLTLDDATPAVVRFALLRPNDEYSHCLGRRGNISVLASHLGIALAMGMTVRQAAEYSGYIYQANVGGKKPFVFVFLPSTKDEAISPTWGQLMPRMKDLVANQQNLCPE